MDYSPWSREELDMTERLHIFICDLRDKKMEKAMAPHSSTLAWKIP